jgi:adenylate kinase family enzyme
MKQIPKRIAIIGLPGSGKSTLAGKLGKFLNIPVHHLDRHLFVNNVRTDQKEFVSIQQGLVNQESWIIEGCSITTLEMRFARADMILYLRFSRLFCAWRVFKRALFFDQEVSSSGCAETVSWALLKYIWNFEKEKRMRIEQLRNLYPHVQFQVFHHPREVVNFLNHPDHTFQTHS